MKIEPGKLNRYFVFGAYGSDSPDRAEITRQAVGKAARLHGHELSHDEVCVVGDTPRDIDAARAAGVTAVGVASGRYGAKDFAEAGADYILQSLTERFPGM
jgi:phosphoglycolate phosphatase